MNKYPRKQIILGLLKIGTILTVAMVAPKALRLFKNNPVFEPWQDFDHFFLRRNIKNLKRKGLVSFSKENDQTVVKITNKGKTEILKYEIDKLKLKQSEYWDGKWRVVLFDIPKKKKIAREVLRNKLKELNFYPYQKSVFISPLPCEKEIKFLREVLEIPHEVKIIIARKIENEEELKKMFDIG